MVGFLNFHICSLCIESSSFLPSSSSGRSGGNRPRGAPGGMLELRFWAAQGLGAAAPCSPVTPTTRQQGQPWWAHLTKPRHRHIWQQSSEPGLQPANRPYPTALLAPWLWKAPGIDAYGWGRETQVSALRSPAPPAPLSPGSPHPWGRAPWCLMCRRPESPWLYGQR